MPTTHARAERAALAELLLRTGPDAPTLCAGWTTRDLAAHLVVRELRPDTGPGLILPPFAGWTEKVRLQRAARPYEETVRRFAAGPPRLSVFAIPGVDEAANTVEYLIHHEDVRRAGPEGAPARELDPGLTALLWKRAATVARMTLRKVPVAVALRRTDVADGTAARVHKGSGEAAPLVTVSGAPAELLLFLYGRKEHAEVTLKGEDEAVRRLREASTGV